LKFGLIKTVYLRQRSVPLALSKTMYVHIGTYIASSSFTFLFVLKQIFTCLVTFIECNFLGKKYYQCTDSSSRVTRWYVCIPKIPIWVCISRTALEWRMLVYFMFIWNIIRSLGLFYNQLIQVVIIWCIFPILVWCIKKPDIIPYVR
jgi:hypothetical protein